MVGPVSKDVYGLEIFCKALLGSESLLDDAMDPRSVQGLLQEAKAKVDLNSGTTAYFPFLGERFNYQRSSISASWQITGCIGLNLRSSGQ